MPQTTLILQPGKTYALKIRGVNGNNKGQWSEIEYFNSITDSTSLPAPTNLTATGGRGIIQLDWINPFGYDFLYCRVYLSTNQIQVDELGRVINLTPILNVDADAVTIANINPGTYYCRVEAVDRAGNRSAASGQVIVSVTDPNYVNAHANHHHSGGIDELYFSQLKRSSNDSTTHDNYTSTPHVSSSEKNNWNSAYSHSQNNDIHLTLEQKTDLTDNGDCSIHRHDDRYYTETESDNRYSQIGHDHNNLYSLISHNHNSFYAPISHNNSNHTENYITQNDNARVAIRKNNNIMGIRRAINLIEGTNINLNIVDDSINEKVDITISSTASGGGGTRAFPFFIA